jgi:hypothetical protein
MHTRAYEVVDTDQSVTDKEVLACQSDLIELEDLSMPPPVVQDHSVILCGPMRRT